MLTGKRDGSSSEEHTDKIKVLQKKRQDVTIKVNFLLFHAKESRNFKLQDSRINEKFRHFLLTRNKPKPCVCVCARTHWK